MEGFTFVADVQVRWRDLDANGHVNNAAIVTFLETARTELWRQSFGGDTTIPFVVGHLDVEYRRPITLNDRVLVGLAVSELRGASYTFRYRVEASGHLAAEASTLMVHVGQAGRPTRLPAATRRRLEALVPSPGARLSG